MLNFSSTWTVGCCKTNDYQVLIKYINIFSPLGLCFRPTTMVFPIRWNTEKRHFSLQMWFQTRLSWQLWFNTSYGCNVYRTFAGCRDSYQGTQGRRRWYDQSENVISIFLARVHMQANKANTICLSQTSKILDKNCFTKKKYCQIVKFDNHGHAQKQLNICWWQNVKHMARSKIKERSR